MNKPAPDVPNAARIYDYLLGGKGSFPADQRTARKLLRLIPAARAATPESVADEANRRATAVYSDTVAPIQPRTVEEIAKFFDGLKL